MIRYILIVLVVFCFVDAPLRAQDNSTLKRVKQNFWKQSTDASLATVVGDAYMKYNFLDSAIRYYEISKNINPADGYIVYKLTKTYCTAKKYNKAIELLEKNSSSKNKELLAFLKISLNDTSKKIIDVCPIAINTKGNEFSPLLIGNQLFYTSDNANNPLYYSSNEVGSGSYFQLNKVVVNLAGNSPVFDKAKGVSFKIDNFNNNGTCSYDYVNKEIYFTRIPEVNQNKDSSSHYNPQIYYCRYDLKGKPSKPMPFKWNNRTYASQHPTISADGNTMLLSSNKTGGFGKFDLYYCKRNADKSWSEPVSLGGTINTAENEVFPTIKSDGTFCFSSTGLPGYGGLDIFTYSSITVFNGLPLNAGWGINSNADDFGITYSDSLTTGFLSSNRGEKGSDDNIYFFKIPQQKTFNMEGRLLSSLSMNASAPFIHLALLNKIGEVLQVTLTDSLGNFIFYKLDPNENYLLKIDEQDQAKLGKNIFLQNNKQRIVGVAVINEKGQLIFYNQLPSDLNKLPEINMDDPQLINVSGNIYASNKSKKDNNPVANKYVLVMNEKGVVVQRSRTNAFGTFTFTALDPTHTYVVSVEEEDPTMAAKNNYFITDKSGKEIKKGSAAGKNVKFIFTKSDKTLAQLKVERKEIRKNFKGRVLGVKDKVTTPLLGCAVSVLDDNGKVVRTIVSKEAGAFSFMGLSVDSSYMISLDENDPVLKDFSVVRVEDDFGNFICLLDRHHFLKYKFKVLKDDDNKLSEFYVDDPWLQLMNKKQNAASTDTIVITEDVHYAVNSAEITIEAAKVLDKVIGVLKVNNSLNLEVGAHTDSRSSDDYNLKLSKKRADKAVEYMVAKGIKVNRLKAIGYGETKLKNKCANDITCSEEEHAVNRRTEFTVYH